MLPIISIIIPVYNVEKYLRKCLDSCVNQTFKEIEIIVVNDASPDNSALIMKEYEENYPDLVRCIYLTENVCLGGARNRGIDIARGEYIMFVDSDDWIDLDMCERMYNSAKINDADMVLCNAKSENLSIQTQYKLSQCEFNTTNVKKELVIKNVLSVAWGRLIKKNVIIKSDCLFPEKLFYEDNAVVFIWVMKAKTVNALVNVFYHYFQRNDSITGTLSEEKLFDFLPIINIFLNNIINSGLISECMLLDFLFDRVYYTLFTYRINQYIYRIDYFEKLRNDIIKLLPDIINLINNSSLSCYQKEVLLEFFSISNYMETLPMQNDSLHKPFCLWGYGKHGKAFLKFLKNNNKRPDYIIDSTLYKQIRVDENNIPIVCFDQIKQHTQCVVIAISNLEIFNEIEAQIKDYDKDIDVINYFSYLFDV